MEAKQAFLNEILETSAILALVPAANIGYVAASQDAAEPYIVVGSISKVPVKANFAAASGRDTSRIQVSIFASTYKTCNDIAAAIRTALDGFKGEMGGTGGRMIGGCFLENEYDLPRDVGLSLYGVGVDYMLEP